MRPDDLGPITGYSLGSVEDTLCYHLIELRAELVRLRERAELIMNMLANPKTQDPALLATSLFNADQAAHALLETARARMFRPQPEGAARSRCQACGCTYGTHVAGCPLGARDRTTGDAP